MLEGIQEAKTEVNADGIQEAKTEVNTESMKVSICI